MQREEYLRERFREAEKKAIEVIDLIKKVKHRNKTLFNLLRLMYWVRFGQLYHHEDEYDIRKYVPKRGRKGYFIPLKFVMWYLGVTHRTAQDYLRTIEALFRLETLSQYTPDILEGLALASKKK